MRVTTSIFRWLNNSDFCLEHLCTDSSVNDPSHFYQSRLHRALASSAYLTDSQILGTDFDDELQLFHNAEQDVSALFIEPKNACVAFYVFGNDDKYFLLDRDMTAYQDSTVYASFYERLPTLHHTNTEYIAEDGDLWIMPRAQYGHFIFDDVLPSLVSYFKHFGTPPKRLHLIRSRSWQLPVLQHLSRRIFGQSVHVVIHDAPTSSCLMRLSSGLIVLPSYWRTFIQAKEILHSTSTDDYIEASPSRIFLSRKGFDATSEKRLLNDGEVRVKLVEMGFIEVAPHEHDLSSLFAIMSRTQHIISEPGTTPLIGYLCAGKNCLFTPLLSYRCLTDCQKMYTYSGWRYHIPWIPMIKRIWWGFPESFDPNPFSDRCWYDVNNLRDTLV